MTDLSGSAPEVFDVAAATGATPPYEAVIFDMDGVVTDTAALHAAAWKQLFDEVLADHRDVAGRPAAPFDPDADYRVYVDGWTREDGVSAFLTARGVDLPAGHEGDPAEVQTVHGLAARKNGALPAPSRRTRGPGLPRRGGPCCGGCGSGGCPPRWSPPVAMPRRCWPQPASATCSTRWSTARTRQACGCPANPTRPCSLEAARRLGVDPHRAAVVEDATAGVQSAHRGGFGLVVGVDRAGNRGALEAAGADVVVGDVGKLDLGVLRAGPWRWCMRVSTPPTRDIGRR